jgi:hypothetical protein
MSETALTLIKSAMRKIGALAAGEDPTTDESADGLLTLQMMLRNWSANSINIYYTVLDTVTLTGAESYTIGTGGTVNSARPEIIVYAYIRDSNGMDHKVIICDEKFYRGMQLKGLVDVPKYLWYSPEYPLGKIYVWPLGGGTLYLSSYKQLTDPSLISSTISFPPEYDEAIVMNLAMRLGLEYGRPPDPILAKMAVESLREVETKNFISQVAEAKLEILRLSTYWSINEG